MSCFLFSFPPVPAEALGVVTYSGRIVMISSVGSTIKRILLVFCSLHFGFKIKSFYNRKLQLKAKIQFGDYG